MTKKERVAAVLDIFDQTYPDAACSLNYTTPLELLIATQLSAQCTDARVNIVTKELFKKYKTVHDFADADISELQDIIRSTGFYRNKAKNIISCCRRLIEAYNGEIPDNMDDLLTLAGTGRKTANLVLGDVFGKSAVVVDTHVARLSRRIGFTTQTDPVKIEFALRKIIPEKDQLRMCHQMVAHGRAICTARNPKCGVCPIASYCKLNSKNDSKASMVID
ncbi:MAG: endonuclease III [Clostridia bacterium]|nr:endonuclease III [Clostridia bacterium]